jgi:hypothetical protein
VRIPSCRRQPRILMINMERTAALLAAI